VNDASSRSTAGLQSRRTNKRPANSGLVAKNQEISIYVRMRGGAERSPTLGRINGLQKVRVEKGSLGAKA
jgi:hypothetical protein